MNRQWRCFIIIVSYIILFTDCNKLPPGIEDLALSEPNIILIMTDDQGYGDLGYNGNPIIKTPHLDRLASESVSFSNFHVGTSCAPTRAGLLSGVHCNRAGAWHTINGRSFLSTSFPTIAQYLKDVGYQTGIFGKWHLGDNYPFRPQDRGFDEVLVHGGGGVGQTPDYWNNDYYDDTYFHNGKAQKYEGYCTDVWFNEAINFIQTKSQDTNPFFCYISTNAPHKPHHVPQRYIDIYKGDGRVPDPNFYGQITNIDDNYKRLEEVLIQHDLDDNTIIVFLTDNGTASGAILDKEGFVNKGYNALMRGKKTSEYEGGHRVPLFIKFPQHSEVAAVSYDHLVSYMDIMPTLLDIVGIEEFSSDFDGTSILPLVINGKQNALDDRILITDTQRNEFPVKWKQTSVMQGHWRLVNQNELYDLTQDPSQKENRIDDYPEIVNDLRNAYEFWWSSIQRDIHEENRIVIGSDREQISQLTSHDWHSEENAPWHQRHIRAGQISNGTWWLEVEKSGWYDFKLYRYPPDQSIAFNEQVAVGDKVDGGLPLKTGMGLDIEKAKISIQGQSSTSTNPMENTFFEFALHLDEGKADLKTTIIDTEEIERGAYYVEVKKIDQE